jgi:hypothetical protein
MKIRTFFTALTALALCASLFSCNKEELSIQPPSEEVAPNIPSGDRIIIHFGTSTQKGCIYSFTNCIWIGWGAEATNRNGQFALQFDQGDEAGEYFGQYFPLTADFTVDSAAAQSLGIEPQVIPAGLYPLQNAAGGQATRKRFVSFDPATGLAVGGLVNPNNPQDNIGQLHNLAVQVVLNENRAAINALNGNRAAIQQLLTEKTSRFLADAGLPVSTAEQQRSAALNLHRDYANYADRLAETRLSAYDKQALLPLFNEAASFPVRSPEELSNFVAFMTAQENRLAQDTNLNNPKVVLSMLSTLKYSRYLWFWKSISSPAPGNGSVEPVSIPDWVWADIIGLELGGPLVSVVSSIAVYLETH